jgi:hypothetical protein
VIIKYYSNTIIIRMSYSHLPSWFDQPWMYKSIRWVIHLWTNKGFMGDKIGFLSIVDFKIDSKNDSKFDSNNDSRLHSMFYNMPWNFLVFFFCNITCGNKAIIYPLVEFWSGYPSVRFVNAATMNLNFDIYISFGVDHSSLIMKMRSCLYFM